MMRLIIETGLWLPEIVLLIFCFFCIGINFYLGIKKSRIVVKAGIFFVILGIIGIVIPFFISGAGDGTLSLFFLFSFSGLFVMAFGLLLLILDLLERGIWKIIRVLKNN